MRILGIFVAVGLAGLAAFQSILGGAPIGEATPVTVTIAASDICPVKAMTVPVVRRETRSFTMMPAHKNLAVTPAKFGTRIDELVVVPEHREGATFFTEQKRIIVTDPTRRLRAVEPKFETVSAIAANVTRARVSEGILITDSAPLNTGPETKILTGEARIQAVRLNAGLKMQQIKVIDTDGDGALVPAKTILIEVRTVETHPAVTTTAVEATVEEHEIDVIDAPARNIEVDALCTMAGRTTLIEKVQTVLGQRGLAIGEHGVWSSITIDAVAAAQAEETELVSPYLLLQTLQKWLPEVEIPSS